MTSTTIDIDTGGTFTDGFVVRDGEAHVVKVLTTPHDLAVCFRDVLARAAEALGTDLRGLLRDTVSVRYATTVGTNAVIERSGPRLGLLTRSSGRAAGDRCGVDLFVDPAMVADVAAGDPSSNGHGADTVESAMRSLLEDGARGLVASLGGGAEEARVRERFERSYPLHCLDTVPLLLASEVSADADEARRTATALFNAYVHPDVADFLYRAEDHLRDHGYTRPLVVVHNDGGAARVARTVAGKTYNSGPVAGLLGARAIARREGLPALVTLDMGGTSLDVGLVRDGEIPMRGHGVVEGVEIAFPLPDLVPLGAGGGSIAWLDGDELRVGPHSAGATPGPACFGFGGEDPTVTDADVVLGFLRPDAFMGGRMTLDVPAAERALTRLAEPLGCTVEEAAERVRAAVHAQTAAQLGELLRERGVDPRRVTVLAFGGNGATHCAGIAQAAGIGTVLVSPYGPVFSAFGASTADLRHRHEGREDELDEAELRRLALRDMRGEGVPPDAVDVTVTRFTRDGERWLAVESTYALARAEVTPRPRRTSARPAATHAVRWPGVGTVATAVHDDAALGTGDRVVGPALVDSGTTTCVVPPGWTLAVDDHGVRRMRRDEEETT